MFRMREKGGLSTLMPLIVVASFVFLSTDARASQVQPPAELRLLPGSAHPPTIACGCLMRTRIQRRARCSRTGACGVLILLWGREPG